MRQLYFFYSEELGDIHSSINKKFINKSTVKKIDSKDFLI